MFNYDVFFLPVNALTGINKNVALCLERLEIRNIRDLVFYKPHSYQVKTLRPDLSKLKDGQLIQTEIIIQDILIPSSRRQPIKILGGNDTGSILLVFFNKIPPFIFSKLKIGSKHTISGKVQFFDYYFQISHPEFILNKKLELALEPLYGLTYGLVNKQLYSYILSGITLIENHFQNSQSDYINSLLENLKILHLYNSILLPNQISDAWNEAIIKLAEHELMANQLFLQNVRKHINLKNGRVFPSSKDMHISILTKLNFQLTQDQEYVIKEIEQDQGNPIQMMRLLQGDVGSGKTLVALLTMVNVVRTKCQATLMAPTDLLANQHYQFCLKALDGTSIKIALLTGKTSPKERKKISEELVNGEIDILIGTHALFQEKVTFKDLAYIVIDEQQRFGVEQRLNLISKASHPDVLAMTATPIPRSLALTMFGDMAISKLKTKPQNRLAIVTSVLPINRINKIIEAVQKKINTGEKAYWICPLIDQSEVQVAVDKSIIARSEESFAAESFMATPRHCEERSDEAISRGIHFEPHEIATRIVEARNDDVMTTNNDPMNLSDVISRYANLVSIFGNKVGIMHGKMKAEEKDYVMQQFRNGEILILVSTTVIEVGIDVPDATLIIIEDSQQFGLAQLHQLRGRVGRGNLQSYCIMLYNQRRLSDVAKKRFAVMKKSNDGFYIAEQDLILRGSGEILGTRQSGEPKFFFADITRDLSILVKAHNLSANYQYSEFTSFQIKLFTKEQNAGI